MSRVPNQKLSSVQYKRNLFYYPKHSLVGEYIAAGQTWDGVLMPILSSLFEKSSTPMIVEVGTNIGASLVPMEIALPHATFYCFEPVERFRTISQKNIESYEWNNIHLEDKFISDRSGEIEINTNNSTASAAVTDYPDEILELQYVDTQKVKTTSLDEYFSHLALSIDFLKIDTDGYEGKVLRGATNILKRDKPYIFMEFDPRLLSRAGFNALKLLQNLKDFGYIEYLYISNFGEALGVENNIMTLLKLAEKTEYYFDLLAVNRERMPKIKLTELKNLIGRNYKMELVVNGKISSTSTSRL